MIRNKDIFLKVQKTLNERFSSHHGEYVDLGLPSGTLWATCNLGAKEPNEAGLYFAWGETKGYTAEYVGKDRQFSEDSYEHLGDNSIYDSNGILKPQFDAATVNLGDEWRMPTIEDFEELLKLENEWIVNYNKNSVNGRLFKGYNGRTLFIPAAGYAGADQLDSVGDYGIYWSSSFDESEDQHAHSMYFNVSDVEPDTGSDACPIGLPVRPVRG